MSFTKNAAKSEAGNVKEQWYVADEKTKRVAPSAGDDAIKAQLAEIDASNLPAALKAAAKAGIKSLTTGKPFALQIERGTGKRTDLIGLSGEFRFKRLSPRLLAQIAEHAEFIRQYLTEFADSSVDD